MEVNDVVRYISFVPDLRVSDDFQTYFTSSLNSIPYAGKFKI